jgi:HEAT repeat protein
MYLLNPMVVTEDCEWEAWLSADWLPGVIRYPSFAHLMLDEYGSFRSTTLNDKEFINIDGPFKGVYAPDKPRCQAQRIGPGKPPPRRLTIEELVQRLNDPSPKVRKNAAQKLFLEFKPHDPKSEKSSLVDPLSRILQSSLETDVRCAAAYMLGTYGNEDAIEPLVAALKDPAIASSAVGALRYLGLFYKSSLITDGLCAYLSLPRDYSSTMTAIHILEDYHEPRLEAIALRLIDGDVDKLLRFVAALALAHVSERAADEFTARLTHKNAEIREVAAAAIRETHDLRAITVLKKALNDEDPHVRLQAKTSLRFLQAN